jgi:hypothetical protein
MLKKRESEGEGQGEAAEATIGQCDRCAGELRAESQAADRGRIKVKTMVEEKNRLPGNGRVGQWTWTWIGNRAFSGGEKMIRITCCQDLPIQP